MHERKRRRVTQTTESSGVLVIEGPSAAEIAAAEEPVRAWGHPIQRKGPEEMHYPAIDDHRPVPARCFVPEVVVSAAAGDNFGTMLCANAEKCPTPCPVGKYGLTWNQDLADFAGALHTDYGACAHRIAPLAHALLKDLRAALAATEKLLAHNDEGEIPVEDLESFTDLSLEWSARTAAGLENQCERVLAERAKTRRDARHANAE